MGLVAGLIPFAADQAADVGRDDLGVRGCCLCLLGLGDRGDVADREDRGMVRQRELIGDPEVAIGLAGGLEVCGEVVGDRLDALAPEPDVGGDGRAVLGGRGERLGHGGAGSGARPA
jgi:hypothetical protein